MARRRRGQEPRSPPALMLWSAFPLMNLLDQMSAMFVEAWYRSVLMPVCFEHQAQHLSRSMGLGSVGSSAEE